MISIITTTTIIIIMIIIILIIISTTIISIIIITIIVSPQTSSELTKLKGTLEFRMATKASQGEVDMVATFVSNLMIGSGPRPEDSDHWSPFFKLVLKKAERFLVGHKTEDCVMKKGAVVLAGTKEVKIFGREVLEQMMTSIGEAMADPKRQSDVKMPRLRPLKLWRYLLTQEQRAKVTAWMGQVCQHAEDAEGTGEFCKAIAVHGAAGSSTSSSSDAPKSKMAQKQDDKKAEARASMMKFFVGKKSSASS